MSDLNEMKVTIKAVMLDLMMMCEQYKDEQMLAQKLIHIKTNVFRIDELANDANESDEPSINNDALLGVVKISNWISVKDKLPEEDNELLKSLDDTEMNATKNVIVITELGTVSDNRRVKMAVGDKEWVWVMGYDGDEEVTHWIRYKEPK